MAVTDLIKVQSGQEVTWGTTLAATAKWMGVTDATLNIVTPVNHTEKSGFMRPSSLVSLGSFSGEGSVSMDLSYDDILYPLDNFFSQCTAVATVWTYTAPTTAISTPNFYTLEIGATDAGYEAVGALFTELNISGEAGGVWKGTFPFVCKDVNAANLTALTDRTQTLIPMADTEIHLDAWGTAAGTAGVSPATLISFDMNIKNGRHLKQFAGDISPEAWGETAWSGTLTTVMEFNATAKAIVDALLTPALVQRAIEIEAITGALIATIHFYGTLIDGVTLFEDRDGNITVSLTWEGTWEPTQADWLEIIIDGTLAALV